MTPRQASRVPSPRYRKRYHKLIYSTYFRIILSAILIFLLFVTAFLIAYQSETRKKANEDFEKAIPDAEILLPTPVEAPLSGWQTYINEEYKFEFQYPAHWNVDANPQVSFVQLQEVKDGQVTGIVGGITIIDKTASSYTKMLTSETLCPTEAGRIDLPDTVNVYCLTGKDIQTNYGLWKGVLECSSVQFDGLKENPETCPHQFWNDSKDFFYLVHFNFFEPIIEGGEEEKLFNQVLSTFQFID